MMSETSEASMEAWPAYRVAQRSRVSCPHCKKELAVKTLSSTHNCLNPRPRRPRKPNKPTSPEVLQERLQKAQARHWAKFELRMAAYRGVSVSTHPPPA
jgi:hypothetical protein